MRTRPPIPPQGSPARARVPRHQRRATVLIALVVALIVIQLLVIGATIMGSREIALTNSRVEGTRAVYAAEAGANMAAREVIASIDYDSDGKIGGVSDDANSGNNPALGTASFVGVQSSAGGTTTITITATTTRAQRVVVMDLQ